VNCSEMAEDTSVAHWVHCYESGPFVMQLGGGGPSSDESGPVVPWTVVTALYSIRSPFLESS